MFITSEQRINNNEQRTITTKFQPFLNTSTLTNYLKYVKKEGIMELI